MSTTRLPTRLAATAGALGLAVLLAACGGEEGAVSAPSAGASTAPAAATGAEHNDADVRFAQMMIPHHKQAVRMAELAVTNAESTQVKDLAEQIRAAQDPEIATMTGFLQSWGAEVPADDSMSGMDHGGMSGMAEMSGGMTPEQMDQLGKATGAAFDTMFLQLMIAHHEGAVADSRRVLAEGASPQAKDLATKIIDGQTAEIATMQQMLQAG